MTSLACAALAVAAVLQPACRSGSTAETGDDASGTGARVMCSGAAPSFPTFDKTCATPSDCAIGVHQTDCCGATRAIGIAQAEQVRFAADEKTCEDQYPACGCPASPTVAEDGRSAATPGATIAVDCLSGACTTAVR